MSPRIRSTATFLALLVGALPACRCGEPAGPRAYDVGVPLADLPRARPATLEALVPGPVLLYAEVRDGRELADAVASSAWFQALQKNGGARALALSGPAASLSALAQRLNDLSRNPIGEEALADLLDGPAALGVRSSSRGGFDFLLAKSVSPAASGALRLAQMLEAVHPSAQEVVVERYQGLPVRALRLGGDRRLYYVVLRDRLLLATDAPWLHRSLELALGRARASPLPSLREARAAAPEARALLVVDAQRALQSAALGASGRALSGLSWVALRWVGDRVELGAQRAHGNFGAATGSLALPPGTALALAREATLEELLALPAPRAAPDGGAPDPSDEAGRTLLQRVETTLGPALDGHVLYALARSEPEGSEHLLALSTRAPGAGAAALDALVPQLFRAAPARRDELAPGARCVGSPPALCWAELGTLLALSTAPAGLRAQAESPRALHTLRAGPLSAWLDPAGLASLLAHPSPGARRRSSELEPLVFALRLARPLQAELSALPGSPQAWGPVVAVPPSSEPRPARDGGGP